MKGDDVLWLARDAGGYYFLFGKKPSGSDSGYLRDDGWIGDIEVRDAVRLDRGSMARVKLVKVEE